MIRIGLYLQILGRHCSEHRVAITGYCLMSNHVHVLAVPARQDGLAKAFGRAHNDYARWLNVRRGETGTSGKAAIFLVRSTRITSVRRCAT